MALLSFKATNFRCLESAAATFDPAATLIVGPNAAGKTTILEAIGYLGRGKSFRAAPVDKLVRHGCDEFVVTGQVESDGVRHVLGVRNGRSGLETRVDGDSDGGGAALAAALPLQIIGPDVHDLVAGAPEARRKFLDWVGFHVEPGYLTAWRRYRRALRQRNAGLRRLIGPRELDLWDHELAEAGEALAAFQAGLMEDLAPVCASTARSLLQASVGTRLHKGWKADAGLLEALRDGRESDLGTGTTRAGPHRLDMIITSEDRRARKLVSRGQQKLLASGIVLSGVEIVQKALGRPLLLLIDDPAAELDAGSLERLMRAVEALGAQVVATALSEDRALFSTPPTLFHVERGRLAGG